MSILYKCHNSTLHTDSEILLIFTLSIDNKENTISILKSRKYLRHCDNIEKEIDEITFQNILNFLTIKHKQLSVSDVKVKYILQIFDKKIIISDDQLYYLDDCTKHVIEILKNYIMKHTLTNEYHL